MIQTTEPVARLTLTLTHPNFPYHVKLELFRYTVVMLNRVFPCSHISVGLSFGKRKASSRASSEAPWGCVRNKKKKKKKNHN